MPPAGLDRADVAHHLRRNAAVGALDQEPREMRQMPPWHIDRTVGVQKFKNDMSLSDEQIDTIVRWVDARRAARRSEGHAAAEAAGHRQRVEGASGTAYGPPDLVIRSPVHDGRAIIRTSGGGRCPTSRSPSRGGRKMVEIRPTTLKGRRIVHHVVAYLVLNNDPDGVNTGTATAGGTDRSSQDDLVNRRPQLMEWADRQRLRPLSSRHRQAAAARREDLLGSAHSRGRRGDHERIGNRHLVLPEG